MPLNLRGIKARPRDLDEMIALKPALVELHCSVADFDWMPTKQYDIPLAIHLPEYDAEGGLFDIASLNSQQRVESAAFYARAIRCGIAWAPFFKGKPKIVFHPGGFSLEPYTSKQKDAANLALDTSITTMCRVNSAGLVDILVENLPGKCWHFGGDWIGNIGTSGKEIKTICKDHGIDATLDLCHLYLAANKYGYNVEREIEAMLENVKHVHYSDAEGTGGEGLEIGKGTMPIKELTAHIIHLDAVAVPEIWFGHLNGGIKFIEAWRQMEAIMGVSSAD